MSIASTSSQKTVGDVKNQLRNYWKALIDEASVSMKNDDGNGLKEFIEKAYMNESSRKRPATMSLEEYKQKRANDGNDVKNFWEQAAESAKEAGTSGEVQEPLEESIKKSLNVTESN